MARSEDFGLTWNSPSTVISQAGGTLPQIATDSTGRYVFPIWQGLDILTAPGIRTFFPLTRLSSKYF